MESCEPLRTDEERLDDQLDPINSCSVLIRNVAWKTCRERWTIGTGDERVSGRTVLAARYDDDDIDKLVQSKISTRNKKIKQYISF